MVLAIVRVPPTLLWLAGIFFAVHGLEFEVSSPGECDPLNVTWSGGRLPFRLLIIPAFGTIRNISIPASAFNSDSANGSYTVQHLDLPQSSSFMLSMSDADDLFAGGATSLMTVGPSQAHQSCNTTDPGPDFDFSLDSSLAQCRPFPFTQYEGAILPITVLVNVPQGPSFVIHPPPANSFNWTANLTAGTSAVFSVYDAKNRIGGTSNVKVVGFTNDTSCLTSTTSPTGSLGPSLTLGISNGGTSNPSPAHGNSNPSSTHGNSNTNTLKGLAIGISIGVLVLLGFATLLGFCCYRQSKLHKARLRPISPFVDLTSDSNGGPGDTTRESHILRNGGTRTGRPSLYPQPFLAQLAQTSTYSRSSKRSVQNRDSDTQGAQTTSMNSRYPSNVMIHTDISESLGGPIELPPHYSENLPPLPGLPRSSMDRTFRSGSTSRAIS